MATLILGASRGPGRLLFESLRDAGEMVTGIARCIDGIAATQDSRLIPLDASDPQAVTEQLSPDTTLIHCGPPELLTALLGTRPSMHRLVALGSTRLFTRYPDDKQQRVRAMVQAIETSGIDFTLLHPTMIYGAPGLNNIERILRVARVSPVLPLPAAGRALIQPVYAGDVVAAIKACLNRESTIGRTIILPGPAPMTYRRFAETCIRAAGYRCQVISMPYTLLRLAAPIARLVPGLPDISDEELKRLLEDKDFSAEDAQGKLGITLTPLEDGLGESISRRILT